MNKNFYLKLLIIFLVLGGGVYWYQSNIKISGTSANGMWKATYQKNSNQYIENGWTGTLEQKVGDEVIVDNITFIDNDKTLISVSDFKIGKSQDNKVILLYPFSSEFYEGYEPKKGHVYVVQVTWKDEKKTYTDSFRIQ